MTPESLSPADREMAQAALMRLYLKRQKLDARSEWDRQYLRDRGTHEPRARLYALKKLAPVKGRA